MGRTQVNINGLGEAFLVPLYTKCYKSILLNTFNIISTYIKSILQIIFSLYFVDCTFSDESIDILGITISLIIIIRDIHFQC